MSEQAKYFLPLKRKPKTVRVAAFDCEGDGSPGGFVCGSVYAPSGTYHFTDRVSMLEFLHEPEFRGVWIYAHNLEYDLATLTGGDLREFECTFVGDRLLSAERMYRDEHRIKFLDSGNLFPGISVEELGVLVDKPKNRLGSLPAQAFTSGRAFKDFSPGEQRDIRSYNLRDAEIVYEAVNLLQQELNSLGGELRSTLAGCAMDLFRRKYMTSPWRALAPEINRLARQAFYGARTEPYRLGLVNHVNGYDVSSLYPSVMSSCDFPHPGALMTDFQPAKHSDSFKHEGISYVTVEVPDLDPPPLPFRLQKSLYFPQGRLSGVWTHAELRHALAQGCKLVDIEWSIWSRVKFNPFTDFIEAMYKQRKIHAQAGDCREWLFKLILNSSYGRFGLREEGGLERLVPILPETDWSTLAGGDLRFINGWPYALVPIQTDGLPPYANAMFAAQITAEARIKMYPWLKAEMSRLCYTDTDSLWCQSNVMTTEGLGGLRQTHENMELWIVAPKEYAVFWNEGLIEAHAKGVPEAHRLMYLKEGVAEFETPIRLREASFRDLPPATWIDRLKRRHYAIPKRQPLVKQEFAREYFETRPWHLQELLNLYQKPADFRAQSSELQELLGQHSPGLSGFAA